MELVPDYLEIAETFCISGGDIDQGQVYRIIDNYEPVRLESEWQSVDMRVIYHNNGGSGPSSGVASGNNNQVGLAVPTRTNYTFTGWYYDEALTKKVESNKIIELDFKTINNMNYGINTGIKSGYEDLDLYAGWLSESGSSTDVVCPYGKPDLRVIYNTNGGATIEEAYSGGGVAPNENALAVPVKAGYIFDGWYYDSALTKKVSASKLSEIEHEENKDSNGCYETTTVNLYAKWKDTDSKNDALDGEENSGTSGDSSNGDGTVNSGDDEINDSKNPNTGAFATGLSVIVLLGIGLFILYKKHYKYNKFPKI